MSTGTIQYRVHTVNGSWLPWVNNREDYAGIYGQNIDGLQMHVVGVSGYEAMYRAYVGGTWLPWVKGLEDYAGIYGQAIEGIQVYISVQVDLSSEKILRYDSQITPELQKRFNWCGPAAAVNAFDCWYYHTTGKVSTYNQEHMVYTDKMILTENGGTDWDDRWPFYMNSHITGNNYAQYAAQAYGTSEWASKLENIIKTSIDNNLPVIADTYQNGQIGYIHENYAKKGGEFYHYITIIGYTYDANGYCKFTYLDSYENHNCVDTIPRNVLAIATAKFGIVAMKNLD